jgi:hypothetical protein
MFLAFFCIQVCGPNEKRSHENNSSKQHMVYSTGTRCLFLFFILFIEQSGYKEFNFNIIYDIFGHIHVRNLNLFMLNFI